MKKIYVLLFMLLFVASQAQNLEVEINRIDQDIKVLDKKKGLLKERRAELKLDKVIEDLDKVGYPTDQYVKHSAMVLAYSEEHEQAKWVMHMILPDIKEGRVFRSNDFRSDPLILSGSTVQLDYFLTDTLASGEVKYDGFGYDRGHLAPSADFRWSAKALSESYYYSNMSPQLPDFNREIWARLEDHLRKYVMDHEVPLYVLTAPILGPELPRIDRSINKVSIPETYVKIAYDKVNNRAIAFSLANAASSDPLESFAITVNDAEELLDMDVFPLASVNEEDVKLSEWFENLDSGDVEALAQEKMPRGMFNTIVGSKRKGKKTTVCGKVVSSRISRSGHLWLNLDKQFPNQIFSVFIRKDDLVNFSYSPKEYLIDKNFCFSEKIEDMNGTATMNIKRERQVKPF